MAGENSAKLQVAIARLEERADQNDELHRKLNGNLDRIWSTLEEIKRDVARRLPLWATFLISALFSLVSALILYAVSR